MSIPQAELTQLAMLANMNSHRPIKMIIDEVLSYTGLVVEWNVSPGDFGTATPAIKMYGVEYTISYTVGNLRRLLHEMTHVAVFESYGNDGLNARCTVANKGVNRIYNPQYMDQGALNVIRENVNLLGALLAPNNQNTIAFDNGYYGGRLMYIINNPSFEYDTTINEMYIDLIIKGYPKKAPTFSWYQSKNQSLITQTNNANSFYRAIESFARKNYEARRGVQML